MHCSTLSVSTSNSLHLPVGRASLPAALEFLRSVALQFSQLKSPPRSCGHIFSEKRLGGNGPLNKMNDKVKRKGLTNEAIILIHHNN